MSIGCSTSLYSYTRSRKAVLLAQTGPQATKLKHLAEPQSTHLAAYIFTLVPRLASPELNGRGAK